MKELYISAHEELIAEFREAYPDADWDTAYEATADAAYEHMRQRMFTVGDLERLRRKEEL